MPTVVGNSLHQVFPRDRRARANRSACIDCSRFVGCKAVACNAMEKQMYIVQTIFPQVYPVSP